MFARKQIKGHALLSNYKICKYSTLFFVLHMDGGAMGKGESSSSKPYFKDMVKKKSPTSSTLIPLMSSAFIVDKSDEALSVKISNLKITKIHSITKL